VRADRSGAVGLLFGLLAPLLVLVVALGIDATRWYRDSLHLQALADRAAISAGPLWKAGNPAAARETAAALVAADASDAQIDHQGGDKSYVITLSSPAHYLLTGLFVLDRHHAQAQTDGTRLTR
jgi:uncharacterized membrane protein